MSNTNPPGGLLVHPLKFKILAGYGRFLGSIEFEDDQISIEHVQQKVCQCLNYPYDLHLWFREQGCDVHMADKSDNLRDVMDVLHNPKIVVAQVWRINIAVKIHGREIILNVEDSDTIVQFVDKVKGETGFTGSFDVEHNHKCLSHEGTLLACGLEDGDTVRCFRRDNLRII